METHGGSRQKRHREGRGGDEAPPADQCERAGAGRDEPVDRPDQGERDGCLRQNLRHRTERLRPVAELRQGVEVDPDKLCQARRLKSR